MYKLRLSILFFIFLVSFSAFGQCKKLDSMKYNIESAKITYKILGSTIGTEHSYFDNWGERERNFSQTKTTSIFYSVKTVRTDTLLNIYDGNSYFSVDLKNKTGVKTKKIDLINKIKNNNFYYSIHKLKNIGAILIGETKILEKTCQVWKTSNEKIWLWKGMVLKYQSKKTGKKITKEAVAIETDLKFNDKLFVIPENIKLKEL